MQTFLPYPDFQRTAECLDWRRLGKQRVEAKQINDALLGASGWSNHPAVRMWKGHLSALRAYYNIIRAEWIARGYNNTMPILHVKLDFEYPPWFGDEDFHKSHRSNLLRKDPEWYGQFGWRVSNNLPYIWPV